MADFEPPVPYTMRSNCAYFLVHGSIDERDLWLPSVTSWAHQREALQGERIAAYV